MSLIRRVRPLGSRNVARRLAWIKANQAHLADPAVKTLRTGEVSVKFRFRWFSFQRAAWVYLSGRTGPPGDLLRELERMPASRLDRTLPWLWGALNGAWDAVEAGTLGQAYDPRGEHLRAVLIEVRDWVLATSPNLSRMSWMDAIRAAEFWHDDMATKLNDSVRGDERLSILTLPSGHWWQDLREDPDGALKIGAALGHCYQDLEVLESYFFSMGVFTLFASDGKPLLTVAGEPATRGPSSLQSLSLINQARRSMNRLVLPEHIPVLKESLTGLNWFEGNLRRLGDLWWPTFAPRVRVIDHYSVSAGNRHYELGPDTPGYARLSLGAGDVVWDTPGGGFSETWKAEDGLARVVQAAPDQPEGHTQARVQAALQRTSG